MELAKINRSNARLADVVYDRLLIALASGAIAPGHRLVQDKLAEQLDVSRTPVREALLRLEKEGTIKSAGRRGFIVRELDRHDISQLYDAREAVEGVAARLAAARPRKATAHIQRVVDQALQMDLSTFNGVFHANQMIHRSVVEASANVHLLDMFDSLWGRQMALRAYGELFTTVPHHSEVTASHAELIDAIRIGDGLTAQEAMIQHIRHGRQLHDAATRADGQKVPPGDTV